MSQRWFEMIILIIAFLVATAPWTRAADRDPEVDAIVQRLVEHMSTAETLRAQINMEWRCDDADRPLIEAAKYTMAYAAPDKLVVKRKKGDIGATIVSDGESLYVELPFRESYVHDESGTSPGALQQGLQAAGVTTNMPGFQLLGAIIGGNLEQVLMDGVMKTKHLGVESAGGERCDHIRLEKTNTWAECWISQDKEPALMRFVFDMSGDEQRIGDRGLSGHVRGLKAEVSFKKWKFNRSVRDRMFAVKPHKKFQPAASLTALVTQRPPHPMLGKPAPKITLAHLDGGKFDLADLRDDHIVVVDFWATWCGPCRAAFPTLIDVTRSFAGQGVKFYAVNVNEQSDVVKNYLKSTGFDLQVIMDEQGKVARAYHANALPQTVIIDKDGTIQVVHQGVSPTLRKELTDELGALVAGKKLAQKQ